MGKLAGDGNIKLYVKCSVQETGQSFGTQDVVELRKPKLTVTVRMTPCPQGLFVITWLLTKIYSCQCQFLL